MLTYRDGKTVLVTPISADDLNSLHVGGVFYLSGTLTTARDAAHFRALNEGGLPVDLRGGVLLHAGPIVRAHPDGRYEMISVGPTTSMRMERFEAAFIEETGVRLIVGKGGMGEQTAKACRDFGCVCCVMPAGCAVAAAVCVEQIERADWLDLGMPEALWTCRVKDFGPLIVSIDSEGRNYFEEVKRACRKRKDEQLARLRERLGAG